MVKFFYLTVIVLALNYGCLNSKKQLYAKKTGSSKINFDRVYFNAFYSYNYDHSQLKRVVIDSTLCYNGLIFFSNGIFRNIGLLQSQMNLEFVEHLLVNRAKFKDNWGTFFIENDSLILKGWDASAGNPVYEQVGFISDNEDFEILKSRCYSCSKLEVGHSWKSVYSKYKASQFKIKVDSTTPFIKPVDDLKK